MDDLHKIHTRRKTLVVLSVPFQRLIRSHLSPFVLDTLLCKSDVVVVSPFADNPDFINNYSESGIMHILTPKAIKLNIVLRAMYNISTVLRMRGYWFRNRVMIPYYWKSRYIRLLESGGDQILWFPYRLILDLLSMIGSYPAAWKIFDKMHGRFTYRFRELFQLADYYEKVILVQASSWGFQDAVLAYHATNRDWRSVFIPYTTDQLFCNGYLYSEFDKVCVQGPLEEKYAIELHKLPPRRIEKLGSAYIQVIESSLRINDASGKFPSVKSKTIMYAGLSSKYFPNDLELQALRSLSAFMQNKLDQDWKLIYRPVVTSENQLALHSSLLSDCPNIEIAPSNPSMLGLTSYTVSSASDDVSSLVQCLQQVDLLVCSSFTSMVIDAAVCGVPSMSYFPIHNKVLERRKFKYQLDESGRPDCVPSVPVAQTLTDLCNLASTILADYRLRSKITAQILKDWHFPAIDFKKTLTCSVFGDSLGEIQ